MKFKKPIEVQAGISDGDPTNPLGQAGYLLSSDGSNVNWVSPGGLSAETAKAIIQPIKANEALVKGDPLYIVGYQLGQDVNIVAKADSSDVAKMPVVGLADDDYANQAFGTMTAFGSFNGNFDTTGGTENWTIGDIIFVKPGGGLTNIKPGGADLIQNVAIVARVNQNTGELEVIALGRTNDVPNLPTGRLFVGTAANTSLVSDVVYVDDALDRVGIGTNNPSSILHLENATPKLKILSNQYYNSSIIEMGNGATPTAGLITCYNNPGTSALELLYDNGAAGDASIRVGQRNLDFKIDGGTAMYINLSKNVGIGTTDPNSKLQVDGEIDANGGDGYRINGKPWAAESSNLLRLGDWDGEGFKTSIFDENSIETLRVVDKGVIISSNASKSTGYGTAANLLVGGDKFSPYGEGVLTLLNNEPNSTAGMKTGSVQFAMKDDTTAGYVSSSITGTINLPAGTGSSGGGILDFNTSNGGTGSSPAPRMRINYNGNVGIGATNPDAKLEVVGTTGVIIDSGTSTQALLTLKGDASTYGGGGIINIIGGSQDYLYYATNINRSPGTLEAREKYEMYSNTWTWDGNMGSTAAQPYTSYDFKSQGSSQMVIRNNNVGIGTTNPLQKLHVAGSGYFQNGSLAIGTTSNVLFNYITSLIMVAASGQIISLGGGPGNVNNDVYIGNGDLFVPNGDVGIGTSNPQAKLQVNGGVQLANDTASPSALKVGTFRYRTSGNNSYVDMCMQTGASTYAWVNVVTNNW